MEETLKTIKNGKLLDNKYVKKLLKDTKRRRVLDVTDKDFLDHVFLDVLKSPDDLLNLNYFSQYISEIGFRFSLDMVFNLSPGNIYVGICSVNPPGALYKSSPTNDKVVVFSDIEFESFIGAQKFTETLYTFKNVPVDFRTHIIIDIKSIKLKKGAATEVKDYAWTVFPIFSTLDTDENKSTIEMFVKSGIFMLPLINGGVRNDIVDKLKDQNDCWDYLKMEDKRKISSINFMPRSSVVIRCIDNQREGHFKEFLDFKRMDYTFCNRKENYEYSEKVAKHLEKGQRVSSLIPSDKEELDVSEEINALIQGVYKVNS